MDQIIEVAMNDARIIGRREGFHLAAHQLEMTAISLAAEGRDRSPTLLREQATLLRELAERKVQ